MQQKQFPLQNRGMRRDPSISKADAEFAFENHNIRITARDHDTALSVTNERGNKQYEDLTFAGELVGWNVLNSYIILFTSGVLDNIYRVKYEGGDFSSVLLFSGELNFNPKNPIESIVDYENEDNQKIYWIDGVNVLRFLNFSDKYLTEHLVSGTLDDNPVFSFSDDPTWFDSTRPSDTYPEVIITKDNGGNARANGVAQYFLTYYNKHGQQTGIIYSSPLVYLSPVDRGGAADETNNTRVTFSFSGLDTTFEYVRLYEILRTTQDGTITAFLVAEQKVTDGTAIMIDAGTALRDVDASSFLFLGSQELRAGTLTAKDNTLFLGDLLSVGNLGVEGLEAAINASAFILPEGTASRRENVDWESAIVSFQLSGASDVSSNASSIPYVEEDGYYPYKSQLNYTNSQITTFKGGEKYRFALQFFRSNGTFSAPMWIGDKVNPYYPQVTTRFTLRRAIAKCRVPASVINAAKAAGFTGVQLMIAEASYSDRSVLAQGIISPTVFNLYNRHSDAPYAQSSWAFRPKGGVLPYKHLDSLLKSDSPDSEMQCSWWEENKNSPIPVYFTKKSDGSLATEPFGYSEYKYVRIQVHVYAQEIATKYWGTVTVQYYAQATESSGHYTPVGDPGKEYTINIGGGSALYNNSKLQLIRDWQKAYDTADVPIAQRASEDTMRTVCEGALHDATLSTPGDREYNTPSDTQEVVPVDFQSRDTSYMYSKMNREYYFVDENIVTLNSPEIEYGRVNLDKDSGVSLRIVGAAAMSSNISDYFIESENFKYVGDRTLNYNFSNPNVSESTEGLVSWPLYLEYGYEDTSSPTDDKVDTLVDYPFAFNMYMWHKNGSIPMYEEDNVQLSTLSRKRFANLHFAYSSVYNNYKQNTWSVVPDNIRQFDSLSAQIYDVAHANKTVSYAANVDDLVMMPDDCEYPIFFSRSSVSPSSTPSLETLVTSSDPIRLTYNSRAHAVISLPSLNGTDTLLPYIFENEAFKMPEGDNTVNGPIAGWEGLDWSGYKLLYRKYGTASQVPTATVGAYGNFVVKALSSGAYDAVTSVVQSQETVEDLLDAISDISKKEASGRRVFAHITDDQDTKLVDLSGLTIEKTSAIFSWVNIGASPTHPIFVGNIEITSNIPMSSVVFSIYRQAVSGGTSTEVFSRNISVSNKTEFTYQTPVTKENDYRVYAVITVNYAKTYYDSSTQTDEPLVPALTLPALNLIGNARKASATGRRAAFFENALYEDVVETVAGAETQFLDIAYTPESILTRTDQGFIYTGEYNNIYKNPVQEQLTLTSNPFVTEGNGYVLIGELYKDYDALAAESPEKDSRYGGISSSAVESNTFVKAGEKTSLDDSSALETFAETTIDCSSLMSYITSHSSAGTSYTMKITLPDDSDETITLHGLDDLGAEDFLPTSEDKTENFAVYYSDSSNSWKTTIIGYSSEQLDALSTACENGEYKVVIMRYGYARRGIYRNYMNKLGFEQASHTSRKPNYKELRKGPFNRLEAKRFRIIGTDLLISTKPIYDPSPNPRDQRHSSTWKAASAYSHIPNYASASLVSDIELPIVLPELPSQETICGYKRYASKDHFANRACDGIIDLYIGLVHKESNAWELVSNPVKVRGISEDGKKIWAFDETNVVRVFEEQE